MKLSLILVGWIISFWHYAFGQEAVFFTEGTSMSYYDQGIVNLGDLGGSTFEYTHPPGAPQWNDKVPCSKFAWQGNTSLKFNYTSAANGNWQVTIYRNDWSTANLTNMDSLSFYLYSESGIPAPALPMIGLKANKKSSGGDAVSKLYALADYNIEVPAGKWTKIRLPLHIVIGDSENQNLNFGEIKGIVFNQSETNNTSRLLLIDNILAYKWQDEIPSVENLQITGYDSHIELTWNAPFEELTYRVLASFDNGQSFTIRSQTTSSYFLDFIPANVKTKPIIYRVVTIAQERESEPVVATAATRDFTDDELKNMFQRYAFRYFWQGAHQSSGMALERSNGDGLTVASGATGMGLLAMIVAYDREYESRETIKDRILKILASLKHCDRHYGAWSHWYNGNTLKTIPFGPNDDGGDIVETAYVAQGLMGVRNYFSGNDEKSILIRSSATQLWESINWDWYRNGNQNVLTWHWSPITGFLKNMKVSGWDECLAAYIMAASSPTHSVPKEVYDQGWARNGNMVNSRSFYGYNIKLSPDWGGPLFWIHYSFLGINPRGLSDKYAHYWTEHINTVRIHHAYAIENPLNHPGYSHKCWGLTASDSPYGYTAHQPWANDNGTISPTAALASMPYAPKEALNALKYFYRERGKELFGIYGPYDAFNDRLNWVQKSYIGIDQGPIVIMIENQRSGLLWNYVMKDPDLQIGLNKLGFSYETTNNKEQQKTDNIKLFPNPTQNALSLVIPNQINGQAVVVKLFNMEGKNIFTKSFQPLTPEYTLNLHQIPNGLYLIEITTDKVRFQSKLVIKK